MKDKDITKYFNSLYIKLLDVKYDLKITQKEFLALNTVHKVVTRQQAEIENLKVENQSLRGAANSLKMHYEKAQAEIERLKESLNIELENFATEYDNKIKAEAIKEFAERLKDMSEHFWEEKENFVSEEQIDNLVKEMVGENNA